MLSSIHVKCLEKQQSFSKKQQASEPRKQRHVPIETPWSRSLLLLLAALHKTRTLSSTSDDFNNQVVPIDSCSLLVFIDLLRLVIPIKSFWNILFLEVLHFLRVINQAGLKGAIGHFDRKIPSHLADTWRLNWGIQHWLTMCSTWWQ